MFLKKVRTDYNLKLAMLLVRLLKLSLHLVRTLLVFSTHYKLTNRGLVWFPLLNFS